MKLKQNGRLDGTCKFCWLSILTTSDQLKENLWIYHHQTLRMDIRWHKLGWYWFAAISEKQDGHHSQFPTNIVGTNYSNVVQAVVSRFDVQVHNNNTLLVVFFWSDQIETKWSPWLSILTTSDQLKERLWIYHHQTYCTDIRWHKLGWYWSSANYEEQDGHHRQCSQNIFGQITSMPSTLSSPDLTCRWVIMTLC